MGRGALGTFLHTGLLQLCQPLLDTTCFGSVVDFEHSGGWLEDAHKTVDPVGDCDFYEPISVSEESSDRLAHHHFVRSFLHRGLLGPWTRRLTWKLIAATGLLAAIYFSLVVLPIYSEASKTASQVFVQLEEDPQRDKLSALAKDIGGMIGSSRGAHIFAYATLAPMTRTSLPAMHYPIVFPERHPYYGFDFGQDILGFGGMPDDNLVIWKHMYPSLLGAAGAPYQFALYSQVGVAWALMLCFIVGIVLGVMWKIILADEISCLWRSLMGSVLILFSIYLAIDSIRGSLLSSYGLIWAWLFISLFFFLSNRLLRPKKT